MARTKTFTDWRLRPEAFSTTQANATHSRGRRRIEGAWAPLVADDDRPTDPEADQDDEPVWCTFGPRMRFAWLIGESSIWAGPASIGIDHHGHERRCLLCGKLEVLPPHAYCLGCDRSGRDVEIGPAPLRKRVRRVYQKSKLKGGTS